MLNLFNYRFPSGAVEEHSFGNLFLAALEKTLGGFDRAVEEASRILRVRGAVVPVTLDQVRLHAQYEDGSVAHGETNIDIPKHDAQLRLRRVWLDPSGRLNPKAYDAIYGADLVVVGPGDLYTSIVPNLLIEGMQEALCTSKAPKVHVVNVMTKLGETHGFAVHRFVEEIEQRVGKNILTHVLYNIAMPEERFLEPYRAEGAECVVCHKELLPEGPQYLAHDVLAAGSLIRHDSDKLAQALTSLL